ncbi:MAG: transcription antitermination factor NusB [Eubacterium sp.]|nr:transcription antitermination factor NusB [Eubacterium sp.]
MTRHELRERIFKTIFQIPFYDGDIPELPDDIPNNVISNNQNGSEDSSDNTSFDEEEIIPELSLKDKLYVSQKVSGIQDNLEEIDKIIVEHCKNWKFNRIGKAELAILRLAVYEIKYDEDIPDRVAVNEAIELAKVYGTDKASGFVNGVLSGLI